MSEKISPDYDSSWSASRLYRKDSSYDVSRPDTNDALLSPTVLDHTAKIHDDDSHSATTLSNWKQQAVSRGFPAGMQRRPWIGVRLRMALFSLLAVLCIFAHHSFYAFLDGQGVSDGPLSPFRGQLHTGKGEQALAITIGNALATMAKVCLGGAVVTAFEQLFWWRLKRRARSLDQVDAVLAFRANPLDPTSWTALLSFPFLATIALLAATFVAIPIAAPGALTVDSAAQSTAPCTVPTVNLSLVELTSYTYEHGSPTAGASKLVSTVLMSGDSLPPRAPDLRDLIEYDVSFLGLALACYDITDTFDTQSFLPYAPRQYRAAHVTVWNASYAYRGGLDESNQLVVATRPLGAEFVAEVANDSPIDLGGQYLGIEVVNCTPRMATYNITVQISALGPRSHVNSASILPPVIAEDWDDPYHYYSVYDAFAHALRDSVNIDYTHPENTTDVIGNLFVAFGALALGTQPGKPWVWRTDLMHALPSLMQNISASFLSGDPANQDNSTALQEFATTCTFVGVRFQYHRARLLGTYLVAGACALGTVLLGFVVVGQNGGVGESLAFSRVVGAGMDLRERLGELHSAEAEMEADPDVTLHTRVRVEDKPYGSLIPQ